MKKLLIVVDYQKDFVDGALGFPGAERLDSLIAQRIADYRAAGDDVAFTYDTHGSDYAHTQEGRKLPPAHCLFGTPGWELYGETGAAHLPGDPVFRKPTFPSLELAEWLKGRSYAQVELCGLVSNICVVSNASVLQGHYPNAQLTVDAQLTDSFDKVLHEKVLDVLSGLQVKVLNR